MSERDQERDDFWDVDKLVPKRKKNANPFTTRNNAVDHEVFGEDSKRSEERKLSLDLLRGIKSAEDTVYYNEDAGLIKSVRITRFIDKYDFYGNFRKAALLYYDYKTDKCDFTPFYSYMPQYSQLNSEQKNYYFYWRGELRRKRYLKSDYSYLYLYVYEILNLPDKIPPNEGVNLLCEVWREYRKSLPRIDSYFSLWLQDYCLVYRLSCPTDKIKDFIFEAVSLSEFKEFYLSDIEKSGADGVDAFLAYLSDYDWRRGKYAGGENAQIYSHHMLRAMRRIIFSLDVASGVKGAKTALLKRDAFSHSLCTHAVKCKLTVEYIPLSGNDKIRAVITAAVRYTENKLRALFGVKSRLLVKDFADEYKATIDRYFDSVYATEAKKEREKNIPEYERLYDAPREKLSFAGADMIEKASWSTTFRLVDTVEEEKQDSFIPAVSEITEPSSIIAESINDCYGLSNDDLSALFSLHKGEGEIEDTVAERINEAFADNFGDIILEYSDDKYKIIEDYEEEVGEWLLCRMK